MADEGNKLLQDQIKLLNSLTKAYDKLDKSQKDNLKTLDELLKDQRELNQAFQNAQGTKQRAATQRQLTDSIKATSLAEKEAIRVDIEREKLKRQQIQTEKAVNRQVKAQEGSINALRQANSKLTKERNNLNLSSKEGQKRLKELNKQLDANNKKIRINSDALTQQKINIGNYENVFDALSPSIGGVVKGIQSMTRAALTFIATPFGVVLSAIVVAITALSSYFTQSARGQNEWNKIMAKGGVIIGNLSDLLVALGEALFNPIETLKSIGDWFTHTFGNLATGAVNAFVATWVKSIAELQLIWYKFSGVFTDTSKEQEEAQKRITKATADQVEAAKLIVKGVGDVKGAYDEATEAVSKFIKENEKEIAIATDLAEKENNLKELRRQQILLNATNKKEIQELLLISRDFNNSSEERLEAVLKATKLKEDELNLNKQIAESEYEIIKVRNSLSESTNEDLDAEVTARAKILEVEAQNSAQLRELKNRETTILNEQRAQRLKEEKAYSDELNKMLEDEEKASLEALKKKVDKEIEEEQRKQDAITQIKGQAKDQAINIAEQETIALLANSGEKAQAEIDQNRAELDAKLADENLSEEQKLLLQAQYDQKEKELKKKKAKADKQDQVFKTIIAGLRASVEALPNIFLSGAALAQSVVTAGVIAAKPIPQYDKGTGSLPSLSEVAEKRPEIVKKDGKSYFFDTPTILGKEWKGAEVISGAETANIMSDIANNKFNSTLQERADSDRNIMLNMAMVNAINKGTKATVAAIREKKGIDKMRDLSFKTNINKYSE